MEEIGLLVGV